MFTYLLEVVFKLAIKVPYILIKHFFGVRTLKHEEASLPTLLWELRHLLHTLLLTQLAKRMEMAKVYEEHSRRIGNLLTDVHADRDKKGINNNKTLQ